MRYPYSSSLAACCTFVIFVSCAAVALAGMTQSDRTKAEEVRKEVNDALQAIGSYSAEQRDAAVTKAKDAMAKTDARIEELQQKMDQDWQQMSQDARKKARETMNNLQKQRAEIAEWYGGLKHSSANAWEEIKKGFSKSFADLEKSLEKAREKF